jgi:DNA-binding FrmR family transcriptional regulator
LLGTMLIWIYPPRRGEGDYMQNEKVMQRMLTIEGHLKGISRMVENEEYCVDIIRQIQAVQSALNKVSALILDDHLNSCVITAIQGEDVGERERVLKEIGEIFLHTSKG